MMSATTQPPNVGHTGQHYTSPGTDMVDGDHREHFNPEDQARYLYAK